MMCSGMNQEGNQVHSHLPDCVLSFTWISPFFYLEIQWFFFYVCIQGETLLYTGPTACQLLLCSEWLKANEKASCPVHTCCGSNSNTQPRVQEVYDRIHSAKTAPLMVTSMPLKIELLIYETDLFRLFLFSDELSLLLNINRLTCISFMWPCVMV